MADDEFRQQALRHIDALYNLARYLTGRDADAARVDRAVREVTFRDVPVVRALILVRGLGAGRADEPVLDAMRRRGTVLEDVPGEGIVLSLNGRFWRWRGGGSEPVRDAILRPQSILSDALAR